MTVLLPSVANVLSVYFSASADNLRKGLSWYLDANSFARQSAEEFGFTVEQTTGVIAALSPMMKWGPNKAQALVAFQHGTAMGLGLDPNCVKATRIMNGEGEPLSILGGNKVRAFYSTILDPHGFSIPVIDRHAFDIAVGEVTSEKARGALSRKGMYDAFGAVYVDAAKVAGIGAPQMQAITWMQWREDKGVTDNE